MNKKELLEEAHDVLANTNPDAGNEHGQSVANTRINYANTLINLSRSITPDVTLGGDRPFGEAANR